MNLSPKELQKLDALIAFHVFGYRWFLFTAPDGRKWCSLLQPAPWIEHQSGKQIDHPAPGDDVNITNAPCYTNGDDITELMQKCLEKDPEHPLELYKCFDGFYYGDVQSPRQESIPLALVIYALNLFKITV